MMIAITQPSPQYTEEKIYDHDIESSWVEVGHKVAPSGSS